MLSFQLHIPHWTYNFELLHFSPAYSVATLQGYWWEVCKVRNEWQPPKYSWERQTRFWSAYLLQGYPMWLESEGWFIWARKLSESICCKFLKRLSLRLKWHLYLLMHYNYYYIMSSSLLEHVPRTHWGRSYKKIKHVSFSIVMSYIL